MSHDQILIERNGWTFKRIGKNIWQIFRSVSPHSIVMTGAAVKTQLPIPFPHRWLRAHFYHTSAAYGTSGNSIDIKMTKPAGLDELAQFSENLFYDEKVPNMVITEKFGEGFEYEGCVWSIELTGANTDLVFCKFYVQKLEENP